MQQCCEDSQRGFINPNFVSGEEIAEVLDSTVEPEETEVPEEPAESDDPELDEGSGDEDLEKGLCPDKSCEHDCEMRGDQPTCICRKDFELGSNGISCVEIPCENGFVRDKATRNCEGLYLHPTTHCSKTM